MLHSIWNIFQFVLIIWIKKWLINSGFWSQRINNKWQLHSFQLQWQPYIFSFKETLKMGFNPSERKNKFFFQCLGLKEWISGIWFHRNYFINFIKLFWQELIVFSVYFIFIYIYISKSWYMHFHDYIYIYIYNFYIKLSCIVFF